MLKFNESTKKKMAARNLKLVKQKGEPMKETKQLNILDNEATMTSREIAELTGKEHRHVIRDTRNMLKELDLGETKFGRTYLDVQGKERPYFKLPKDLTLTLVSGYNIKMRHAIIRRWKELEAKVQTPKTMTLVESLELNLEQAKENEKLTLKIEQDKPKIGVFNAIANTYTDVTTTHLAKALGTTGVKLNQFLRKYDVKFMHKDFPKAKYIDWFNVINGVSDSEYSYTQTLITSTGQVEITKMWLASNPEN